MALLTSLETAKRALMAQRYGMDVTSNNIANVNTPGYARRSATLVETNPNAINRGFIGTGVVVDRIQSFRQEYFDREVRNNLSRKAGYEADDTTLKRVETSFAEPSDYGLDSSINKFFSSFEALTLQPENITRREEMLSSAQNVAENFNNVGRQLFDLRQQTDKAIDGSLDSINQLLSNIAELNSKIGGTHQATTGEVSTLVDLREQKLEELSKLTNIQVNYDANNLASVSVSGETVVSSTTAQLLQKRVTTDPATLERTISIDILNRKSNQTVGSLNPASGELSSQLKHYNVTLDDRDSSGGYSVVASLNTIADNLVTRINALSTTGYGLDDAGPAAPGRNIFTPAAAGTTVTALSISVSTDIAGQPRNIPISATPLAPGNSEVGRRLAALAGDKSFLSGNTPAQAYSLLLSKVGSMGQEAITNMEVAKAADAQLVAQREAVAGVNLDEEAMNLIRFQKAFEAAARVVNTTNEMLGAIINLGR